MDENITFNEAARRLVEFDRIRQERYKGTLLGYTKLIARRGIRKAFDYHVVEAVQTHNEHIPVMVIPRVVPKYGGGGLVGRVQAVGLVAKIQLGRKARKFWATRKDGKPTVFMSPGGFRTATKRAGGQRFKRQVFVEATESDASRLAADIEIVLNKASSEIVG